MKVYTGEETRALDRRAIDDFGIPGIRLMHRAGIAAFRRLRARWPEARRLTIVCGAGNNAGDGYIVAGAAADAGFAVQLVQVGDLGRVAGDARSALEFAQERIGPVTAAADSWDVEGDVVVDALLGTGVRGEVRGAFRDAIGRINAAGRPVLALDLPSGIDADTGAALTAEPVRAELTVTFIALKLGLVTGAGIDHAGEVALAKLDVPADVFSGDGGTPVLDGGELRHLVRRPDAHKGDFGRLLIVGGALAMGGAVILAGGAALRTGAGLVTVATREANRAPLLARHPELMVRGIDGGGDIEALAAPADAIVLGPGLGRDPWGTEVCRETVAAASRHGVPMLLDADGLNIAARDGLTFPANTVITPHPGEAGRLLGTDAAGIQAARPASARRLSALGEAGCAAVLKGAGSLVASRGELDGICLGGNPRMAAAGSGDVLSGIGGALLGQGLAPLAAARLAVWLHARAGDEAAAATAAALKATDLIDALRLDP